MKKHLSYILAGILGGATVIGVDSVLQLDEPKTIIYNQSPKGQLVGQRALTVPAAGVDFVSASEKATDVVVHIFAQESMQLAQQRLQERRSQPRSPFDDFFGSDFFGSDFFGRSFGPRPQNGSGSGVIVSSDGYIVTNNHVVGFADDIKVTLNDGREVKAMKVGTDPSTDLAVIKIELDERLPTLDYANSNDVRVGEWVLAVGNPFSYLTSTVTAGIVSAKGRDLNLIEGDQSIEEFIQTDAVVNPGNSGGALVNTDGKLIGINTAIATPTGVYAGYSFAIPANVVSRVVDDIIENGDVERTNLGVTGYDVNDAIKKEFGLTTDAGFYVASVSDKSAAHFGGLLPGDVIVRIEDTDIQQFEDIADLMKYNKVGDVLRIRVLRAGKVKTMKVVLRKGV